MKLKFHSLSRSARRSIFFTLMCGSALTLLIWKFPSPDERNTFVIEKSTFIDVPDISLDLSSADVIGAKQCFQLNGSIDKNFASTNFFEDVMKSTKQPTPGKSIFFLETSCSKDSLLNLNARQACAIESAASRNPNRDVFVLSASPIGLSNDTTSVPPIVKALQSYTNIYFRNIHLWTYSAETPLEEWFLTDKLFTSQYIHEHVSDYLRFVTLYKFGGTYLDLDVVVQKTFENLTANYAGAESADTVAIGVLSFQHDGIGHQVADMCIREFTNFDGDLWSYTGTGAITRTLQAICHVEQISEMTPEKCSGFTVYSPESFYPIFYPSWEMYFDPERLNETLEKTKDSIVIHVWNKLSANRKLKVNTKVAYGLAAATNCPRVYRSCGEYF